MSLLRITWEFAQFKGIQHALVGFFDKFKWESGEKGEDQVYRVSKTSLGLSYGSNVEINVAMRCVDETVLKDKERSVWVVTQVDEFATNPNPGNYSCEKPASPDKVKSKG